MSFTFLWYAQLRVPGCAPSIDVLILRFGLPVQPGLLSRPGRSPSLPSSFHPRSAPGPGDRVAAGYGHSVVHCLPEPAVWFTTDGSNAATDHHGRPATHSNGSPPGLAPQEPKCPRAALSRVSRTTTAELEPHSETIPRAPDGDCRQTVCGAGRRPHDRRFRVFGRRRLRESEALRSTNGERVCRSGVAGSQISWHR